MKVDIVKVNNLIIEGILLFNKIKAIIPKIIT